MRATKSISGRSVLCEGLESRNLFSGGVGIDAAFKGGIVQTPLDGLEQGATASLLAKDGRVFIAGYDNTYNAQGEVTHPHLFVLAYNKDGSLSTKFGSGGKLILDEATSTKVGQAFALQQAPDGGLYLVGDNYQASANETTGTVLKLNLNGTVATAYGKNGLVTGLAAVPGAELSDGTLRDAVFIKSVLYYQQVSPTGKVTTLHRTFSDGAFYGSVNLAGSTAYLTRGLTVAAFKTADLSKVSGFGVGGTLDLKPTLDAFAKAHGPWTDSLGDSEAAPTDWSVYGLAATKTGLAVIAHTDEITSKFPEDYNKYGPDGTSVQVAFNTSGKSIVTGVVPATAAATGKPVFNTDPDDAGGFQGYFDLPDGSEKLFYPPQKYQFGGINTAVEAADGSFYLAGYTYANDKEVVTIVHTTPV